MKKLFKYIPLLVLPMMLTSCMDFLIRPADSSSDNDTSSQTTSSSSTTTSTSSDSGSGGGSGGDTNVYPTSLTISGVTSLYIGEEKTLTATYTPSNVTYKTINWYTSNNAVASITSKGKVKGLAAGNVTITAKMKSADGYIEATHNIVVSVPSASGVSLNKTSLTLGFNRTVQLTATVNPIAANQAVTWSTNNDSVASVSSTGLVSTHSTIGNAVITATTVDGGFTASCAVSVQSITGTTVMIYMCGADLESDSGSGYWNYNGSGYQGLASRDLDEIMAVTGQPDDVNIVVETGGAAHWGKSQINPDYLERWEIKNQTMTRKAQLEKVSMGLTSTLQSFIEWGLTNYPAEKYGLIMWNHGGAMGGCCFDENFSNDSILADELYTAVSNARSNKGITDKFEWITYDACLMAVQDVAEYNSYNFNYMLCSQESEGGLGYDYDAWLPTLYADSNISGADLLPVIGSTFLEEEETLLGAYDQTQSVFDLSKMTTYKSAVESFAADLNTLLGEDESKALSLGSSIDSAKKYGASTDHGTTYYPFNIFDVKDALTKIVANSKFSSLSAKAQAVKNAVDQLVIYEDHGSQTSGCGICLFVPRFNYDLPYDYTYGSYVGAHSNFTNWKLVANKVFWAWYTADGYN